MARVPVMSLFLPPPPRRHPTYRYQPAGGRSRPAGGFYKT